jgi:hypothetical protein
MDDLREKYKKVQPVQQSPGLWFYYPDLWYHEKSQLYAWYKSSRGIWWMLDGKLQKMIPYSANLFYCKIPPIEGIYQDQLNVSGEWKETLVTDIGPIKVIEEAVRMDSSLNMEQNFQNSSKSDTKLLMKSFFLSVFISFIFSNLI